MIKNIGRFKQWTGEKFGGAKVTLQTEDFQNLERETDRRREGYENLVTSCEVLHGYLLKKKPSPDDTKVKQMPFESFGTCLNRYSSVFPKDSGLAFALLELGNSQTSIAALQESLANDIKTKYMSVLEQGTNKYKEYDNLKKKLELKRLDYDSKMNRLNKAKKEKPELEQEMQGAKMKYEETEHDLIQTMACLQEFENLHREALYYLLQVQCDYHTQAMELLETIKQEWGRGSTSDPTALMSKMMISREDNSNNQDSLSIQSEKLRKASFDFNGQNDDEISFKIGDLITVIDEIDRGWWVGEANGKRGIFPVNFTEEYDSLSTPPNEHNSDSNTDSVNNPSKFIIHQRPPPPPPSSSHTIQNSDSIRRSSHNPPIPSPPVPSPMLQTTSAPDIITRKSLPPASPTTPPAVSLSRNRSTATRPPPPPPPVRTNTLDRAQRVPIE